MTRLYETYDKEATKVFNYLVRSPKKLVVPRRVVVKDSSPEVNYTKDADRSPSRHAA